MSLAFPLKKSSADLLVTDGRTPEGAEDGGARTALKRVGRGGTEPPGVGATGRHAAVSSATACGSAELCRSVRGIQILCSHLQRLHATVTTYPPSSLDPTNDQLQSTQSLHNSRPSGPSRPMVACDSSGRGIEPLCRRCHLGLPHWMHAYIITASDCRPPEVPRYGCPMAERQ
jgi:hypothetical protein